MPGIINDMGGLKRYGMFALNGVLIPACGCVFGAFVHLLDALWTAAQGWYTKTWVWARADYHLALDEFRKSAPK